MTWIHSLFLVALSGTAVASDPANASLSDALGADENTLVVDLVDGTSLEDARTATGLALEWVHPLSEDEALTSVEVAHPEALELKLEALDLVEAAETSLTFTAHGFPNDPRFEEQWNLHTIGVSDGWRAGGGRGVTVAVIDTGVSAVPDLAGTDLLSGSTFVPGTDSAADDSGHGTHVAGTIAQTTHNGVGVAGVAPAARILPMKVLSAGGSGQSEWIAAAIDHAVDEGAQVINLSLGGPESRVVRVAVEKALAAGVVVVAAAGNSGKEGVSSPANVPGVIAVSATGPADGLAPYSSWGKAIVLSAPGGDKSQDGGGILQDTIAKNEDGHAFAEFQGTSMAAPHVSGAAAVLLGTGQVSNPESVRNALIAGSVDLGAPGLDDQFGHGRLSLSGSLRHLSVRHALPRLAIGSLIGWWIMGLAAPGRKGIRSTVGLLSGMAAGGLFFLPWLPLPPNMALSMASQPILSWIGLMLDPSWVHFPLWASAGLPVVLTLVLGPTRTIGPFVLALDAGIGTHLLWAAATGEISPWMMPGSLGTAWLAVHGLVALICAMATAGVLKSRQGQAHE